MASRFAIRFRNSRIGDFIRWKLELKKIRKFSLDAIFSPFGGRSYVKFLILTRSRTGSNLLIDYLNSHRGVFARSEIFRKLEGRDHRAVLRSIFGNHPFFTKAVGFKIFYLHPLDSPGSGLWKDLEHEREIRVIHLVRENILRSIVSHRIADKTQSWFQKGRPWHARIVSEEKKVHFEFAELLEKFEQTSTWQREGHARFRDHEIIRISYEELTRRPEAVFHEVCAFLGVPYRKPRTTFKKQNPEKLADLVENYGELKEMFRGSKWLEFFEEE